ncbi:MAG: UPF0149 family protein [Pseudomonadota bacterium]
MADAPHYDTLREQFSSTPMALNPAELHGVLCALLSFDAETDPEAWLRAALGDSLEMHELDGEVRQSLYWMFDWTRDNLSDQDFAFLLLVPDDEAPLTDRLAALVAWSAGFSAGIGQRASDLDLLPPEVGEFVTDLAEVIRADTEVDDADPEAEEQYWELAEYVRLGAMTVFESLSPAGPPEGAPLH